jgi:hypothetical protein
MLKPFKELRELDVADFCKKREAKDENGKKIEIPYLPWAKCLCLLYDNGAERVRFRALPAPDGSYLFCGEEAISPTNSSAIAAHWSPLETKEKKNDHFQRFTCR